MWGVGLESTSYGKGMKELEIFVVKAKVPAGSDLVQESLFNKCPGNTYCMLSSALDARIQQEPNGQDTHHQVAGILGEEVREGGTK